MAASIARPGTPSGTMSGTFGMLKMACWMPGSAVGQVGASSSLHMHAWHRVFCERCQTA